MKIFLEKFPKVFKIDNIYYMCHKESLVFFAIQTGKLCATLFYNS